MVTPTIRGILEHGLMNTTGYPVGYVGGFAIHLANAPHLPCGHAISWYGTVINIKLKFALILSPKITVFFIEIADLKKSR